VSAVVFDVGETLADETRIWQAIADRLGVPRFTFQGIVGGLAARGEDHRRVYDILGVEPQTGGGFEEQDLYPDAQPCLEELRRRGYRLGIAGNASAGAYAALHIDVDFVASSAEWGVEKPSPAFFERVAEACACGAAQIGYVGDRVDNDVVPAREAGMLAVHVRRGPWGHLHAPPAGTPTISSLDELPEVLARA
jgi:HAD superfamily hydrolase (TIGR01549 family)